MPTKQREAMVRLSDYVNPAEAAEIIGCTDGRIYQLLRAGEFKRRIPIGKRSYLLLRKDCERIAKTPAKTGRPRKIMAS